ncbi:hypothetical protein [Streptomyces sp. S186]|uniref:hypothetical protein n=1 Tax=Streptomyces sp. S186 TaxID=3434395 RepID=UPI003F676ED4
MSTESQPQPQSEPPARAGQDTPAPDAANSAPDTVDTTPAAEADVAAVPAPATSTGPTTPTASTVAKKAAKKTGGKAAALIFDDPLSQRSSDDTDRGWGERPTASGSAADLARFLDEKPPHHL